MTNYKNFLILSSLVLLTAALEAAKPLQQIYNDIKSAAAAYRSSSTPDNAQRLLDASAQLGGKKSPQLEQALGGIDLNDVREAAKAVAEQPANAVEIQEVEAVLQEVQQQATTPNQKALARKYFDKWRANAKTKKAAVEIIEQVEKEPELQLILQPELVMAQPAVPAGSKPQPKATSTETLNKPQMSLLIQKMNDFNKRVNDALSKAGKITEGGMIYKASSEADINAADSEITAVLNDFNALDKENKSFRSSITMSPNVDLSALDIVSDKLYDNIEKLKKEQARIASIKMKPVAAEGQPGFQTQPSSAMREREVYRSDVSQAKTIQTPEQPLEVSELINKYRNVTVNDSDIKQQINAQITLLNGSKPDIATIKATLEGLVKKDKDQKDQLATNITSLTKEFNDFTNEINSLNTEIGKIKTASGWFGAQPTAKSDIDALDARVKNAETKFNELSAKNTSINGLITSGKLNVSDLQNEIKALQSAADKAYKAKDSLASFKGKIKDSLTFILQNMVKDSKITNQSSIDEMNTEVEAYKSGKLTFEQAKSNIEKNISSAYSPAGKPNIPPAPPAPPVSAPAAPAAAPVIPLAPPLPPAPAPFKVSSGGLSAEEAQQLKQLQDIAASVSPSNKTKASALITQFSNKQLSFNEAKEQLEDLPKPSPIQPVPAAASYDYSNLTDEQVQSEVAALLKFKKSPTDAQKAQAKALYDAAFKALKDNKLTEFNIKGYLNSLNRQFNLGNANIS